MATYNVAIQRIYVSHHSQNCWAFIQDLGWRRLTVLTLPGGGDLGVYQPRHERPEPMTRGSE